MSEETKKKLLELIEKIRAKARELSEEVAIQAVYTAYADGISRALYEIQKEQGHDAE